MKIKKFVFVLLSFIFASSVVLAQDVSPSVNTTYSTTITGNSKPTEATKGYKCDLSTLQRDTMLYNSKHQFGDVIKIYTVCIKKYPDKEYLYNNRANVFKMMKKYNRALKDYDKAIELNPKYLSPYNGKMSVYMLNKNFDKALEFSESVIKAHPKFDGIYYQRGFIYQLIGDNDKALENYSLAIKYEPRRNPAAYNYRGLIYFAKGNYKAAIKDLKKSIKCFENSVKNNVAVIDYSAGDVYYNLGIAYIRAENYKKAITCLVVASKYYEAAGNSEQYKETVDLLEKVYSYYKSIN